MEVLRKIYQKFINPKQFLKFGIVGLLATLIHATSFELIFTHLRWTSTAANICGFLTAFVFSYWLQIGFTFKEEAHASANPKLARVRFIGVSLFGFLFNLLSALLLIDFLRLNRLCYLFVLVFITPVLIYVLQKHWSLKN
jgi:putative flippase GtrA